MSLLGELNGVERLVLELIYGAGLRFSEALRLRIQYSDFDYMPITVWNSKGLKDRITMLPEKIVPELK